MGFGAGTGHGWRETDQDCKQHIGQAGQEEEKKEGRGCMFCDSCVLHACAVYNVC